MGRDLVEWRGEGTAKGSTVIPLWNHEMPSMYKEGVVSIWVGIAPVDRNDKSDVLKDLCGVERYDVDSQEGYATDDLEPGPIADLIRPLSFSRTFIDAAVGAARAKGIDLGRWVTVQYDFDYDIAKTVRPVSNDPVFIGAFPYSIH